MGWCRIVPRVLAGLSGEPLTARMGMGCGRGGAAGWSGWGAGMGCAGPGLSICGVTLGWWLGWGVPFGAAAVAQSWAMSSGVWRFQGRLGRGLGRFR